MYAAILCGEYGSRKAEISAQESTLVARFYCEAVLQRRVLASTSAAIDRAAAGIRAAAYGWAKLGASVQGLFVRRISSRTGINRAKIMTLDARHLTNFSDS